MEIPVWGFITAVIFILGGLSTLVVLLGKLMSKAAKEALQQNDINNIKTELKTDYVKLDVFNGVVKDVEGIGRKVSHLQIEYTETAKKVDTLEASLITELRNLSEGQKRIETLLQSHISNHTREV